MKGLVALSQCSPSYLHVVTTGTRNPAPLNCEAHTSTRPIAYEVKDLVSFSFGMPLTLPYSFISCRPTFEDLDRTLARLLDDIEERKERNFRSVDRLVERFH